MNVSHTDVVADWTIQLAAALAEECSVIFTSKHQTMVETYRSLYFSQQKHPPLRLFVKTIKKETSVSVMLQLMQLFGERPMFVLSYIAGLPKPPHCI
ncbi:MAG: TusE/DsrC/DsvC family sulfur relay protein [Gammaproteobacteria bacterium]|nr:TusE/DsrC/DsvC family sulfur relay protein [Gammaproteobacteria bacterium]MCD8542527.1 TusE/DsrC/DsvC family sulfur relay protein [Gammaproteobacteria bacterium]